MILNSSKTSVLLASGGLDSTTLSYWLLNKNIEFIPLFINYGQHCAKTELDTLREVMPNGYADRVEIIDIADIYKDSESRLVNEADLWKDPISYENLYLPYRSLMLLSIGAAFSQSRGHSHLYSGFINSNHANEIDCSAEFFSKLSIIFADSGSVKIEMPFRYLNKFEVAKIGIKLKAPIGQTFSCQASATTPCGACPNCVDRLNALSQL